MYDGVVFIKSGGFLPSLSLAPSWQQLVIDQRALVNVDSVEARS